MTMVTSKHLEEYEALNGAVRNLKNPLFDEGFRMKRYKNDGTEHHAYHVDSGQEPACSPRRNIAVLIYLNDVKEGGETVNCNSSRMPFFVVVIVNLHFFPLPVYACVLVSTGLLQSWNGSAAQVWTGFIFSYLFYIRPRWQEARQQLQIRGCQFYWVIGSL
jgi:hypothetical protein